MHHEARVAARLSSAVAAQSRLGRGGTADTDDDDDQRRSRRRALPTRHRTGRRHVFRHRGPVFVQSAAAAAADVRDDRPEPSSTAPAAVLVAPAPPRAAAVAREKPGRRHRDRRRRLSVPLLRRARRRWPSAKAVRSVGTAAALRAPTTVLPPAARAAAAAAVRVRPAPAVQVPRKPVARRRAGRHRRGGCGRRPPRRVREELPLRQSQAQDEGARQGEQARVEAPVHGKPAVGPRRRRRGRQKL